jgi:hypothetical protein
LAAQLVNISSVGVNNPSINSSDRSILANFFGSTELDAMVFQNARPLIFYPVGIPADFQKNLESNFLNLSLDPQNVIITCLVLAVSSLFVAIMVQHRSSLSAATPVSDPKPPALKPAVSNPNSKTEKSVSTDTVMSKLVELGSKALTDEEILYLVDNGSIPPYALEKKLEDFTRAVSIRRKLICTLC